MTKAEKTYMLDRLLTAGLANPLYTSGAGGVELHFRCPIRDHEHDRGCKTAFSVNVERLLWHCFKCGKGGSPFQLAEAVLGSNAAARVMFGAVKRRMGGGTAKLKFGRRDRHIERRREAKADPPRIESGDIAIFLRLDALLKYNHLNDESCLFAVQKHPVEWAGEEWLGLPALTADSWKLWGLDWAGRIRREGRSIKKRNVGPISLIGSDKLREALDADHAVPVLYDVEGEGDLLCAIEHGLDPVLTSTGGAGNIKGHELCRDLLDKLDIGEVQIVRDRDDAGRHGAEITAKFWDSMGVPFIVKELPEEVGDGGDLRDYFALYDDGESRHERRAS